MRLPYILILLVLSGCAIAPQNDLSDERYSQLLVGTWISQYSYYDDAEISYGEKTYNPDGTATGFISDRIRLSSGKYYEVNYKSYTSNWRIEDGVLIIWDIRYKPQDPGSENYVIRDRILSMENNKAVFEDLSDGSKFVRLRKNSL